MATIRVLLVDDHVVVRAGIRALLEEPNDIEIVGEAADGRAAIAAAEALSPDVVLMDLMMREMNGLEAAARIRQFLPAARVIFFSMHGAPEYVTEALRAGAAGYVLKEAAPAELETAVRTVMRGETYLSPVLSGAVVNALVQRMREGEQDPLARLTRRQREILRLVVDGRSTRQIAEALGLSRKTVETHRSQLMERLGLDDVPALVRFAIRIGMISEREHTVPGTKG